MNTLNPSIKHHLLIAGLISLWVFYYTYFIQPFNYSTVYFEWYHLSISFGTIAFVSYTIIAILQYFIYTKLNKWHISLELSAVLLFHLVFLSIAFPYYRTFFFGGLYDFKEFSSIVFKSAVIIAPIILLARRYLIKLIPKKNAQITIKGDNKLDVLQLYPSELICISNAQNYVEVFYLHDGQLRSKLIRSSLKKMQQELDFLTQAHRSHLINPSHFKSWKDQSTIELTQIEIPVSKNYKDLILAL